MPRKIFAIVVGLIALLGIYASVHAANPPTSIAQIGGDIHVVHPNGSGYWLNATTTTDVGRGTAFSTALAVCVPGDNYFLASSTFNMGSRNVDLTCNGSGSLSLHGAGKYSTTIISSINQDMVIKVASSSVTSDLTISCTNTAGCYPWGNKTSKVTNVSGYNLNIIGTSDGFYFRNGDSSTVEAHDFSIHTNWDGIFVQSLGTFSFRDCDVTTAASASVNSGHNTEALFNFNGGTIDSFNCIYKASGGSINNYGVYNTGSVATNLYSGKAISSGTSAYDIFSDTGTLNVAANFIYDTTKVLQAPNYLDSNPIIKSFNAGTLDVGINTQTPFAKLHVKSNQSDLSGTGGISSGGGSNVTGSGTLFLTELKIGDLVTDGLTGAQGYIVDIQDNTNMTVYPILTYDTPPDPFTYRRPIARFDDNSGVPVNGIGAEGAMLTYDDSNGSGLQPFLVGPVLKSTVPSTGGMIVQSVSSDEIATFLGIGTQPYLRIQASDNSYALIGARSGGAGFVQVSGTNAFRFESNGGGVGPGSMGSLILGDNSNQPVNKLDVNGGAAFGTFSRTTAPSNGLIVSGNTGIGTSSPWRKFSVNGSSDLGTNALAGYFTATTTTASRFPYASTTAISTGTIFPSTGTRGMSWTPSEQSYDGGVSYTPYLYPSNSGATGYGGMPNLFIYDPIDHADGQVAIVSQNFGTDGNGLFEYWDTANKNGVIDVSGQGGGQDSVLRVASNQTIFADSYLGGIGALKVSIGSSSPYATFTVQSNLSVGDAFVVATTTANPIGGYDNDGHRFTSGPAPKISSCGTGSPSITGDDQTGTITTGTAASSCTMTFAKAYRAAPVCNFNDDSATIPGDISAISTTAVTFALGAGLSGGHLYYQCAYHRN